jgi:hypothetical protein
MPHVNSVHTTLCRAVRNVGMVRAQIVRLGFGKSAAMGISEEILEGSNSHPVQ